MANLNRGIISGVVSNEPDLRTMGGGDKATKVARFSLQIAREYGETYDYVSCLAFGKQAEWIETNGIHAGMPLVVRDGRIQTGSYTGADGKKVYTTEVVCTALALGSAWINKVLLSGNLVRDPEVRYTGQSQDAKAVCHFTVAVKRRFSQENESDFILCTAFGKQGEFVSKQFVQGDNIIVDDGRIQTGSYTNKDGVTVYTTEVIANSVEFGESKASRDARRNGNNAAYPAQPQQTPTQQMPQQSGTGQMPMGAGSTNPAVPPQMVPAQTSQMANPPMPQQPAMQQPMPQQPAMQQPAMQQQASPQQQTPQPPVQQQTPAMPAQTQQSPAQQTSAGNTPGQFAGSGNPPMGAGAFPFGTIPMGNVFH